MQKASAKRILAKQRKVMRDYYYAHKTDYALYRKENADLVREWYDRYRKSPKGKAAIAKYEQKKDRKESKALWNFIRRQKLKFEAGEITEYEMRKKIREYKEKRGLK